MFEPVGRVQSAPSAPIGHGAVLARRMLLPWRALMATALLCMLVGGSLYEGLAGGRASAPTLKPHARSFARDGLLSLPLAAQGPVAAALGADSSAYRVKAFSDGFRASNPAQRLHSTFSRSGVLVSSGETRVGLSLTGIGYGTLLTETRAVAPAPAANRIIYPRSGLTEWYANGPLGLEQGFTIDRAPAGHPSGPLTLAMTLSGDALASLDKGAQGITLARGGKTVLRYTDLSVTDASGRVLHAWLALKGTRLLLRVDASTGRYPIRIDPFIQQGEKLAAGTDGAFGYRVALSADGNTALIGAPPNSSLEDDPAFVFTRSGETWTEQQQLLGAGQEGPAYAFGESVALSADGNTALIGDPDNDKEVGAVWIFTRTGKTWTEQGEKLTGAGESGKAGFGSSVALSSDGNTALVGGPNIPYGGGDGASWVFTRSGETWSQQGEPLTGGGVARGVSVALSSDGNTALIGSWESEATVYTRTGKKWSQQAEILTGVEIGYSSVALSSTGDTALLGNSFDNKEVGAAWVFTRSGEKWTQQGAPLTGAGESGKGRFGFSVALSAEGNVAMIGGPGSKRKETGAVWVFTRIGEKWTQQGGKLVGEGEFGTGVALSSEGNTAMIGGPNSLTGFGTAWAFVTGPTVRTGFASEVMSTSTTLNGTVNPNGETVTSCELEYGTTESYGSSVSCSPSPGSGSSPVAVSGSLTGLSPNTTYHFRISASSASGMNEGSDQTFTTTLSSESATTTEPAKPATASDGQLSGTASGGTGTLTVGLYGSALGGGQLFGGSSDYVDVNLAAGSTFTKLEFTDCELGGKRAIWWDDPATGWEPISEPPAVYKEAPTPCVTVTITEATKPSLAQMTGTRFGFAELTGEVEYGKCEAIKDGEYTEGACNTLYEKKGTAEKKGKYEWYRTPADCFSKKDGRYSESNCQSPDVVKGKAKGKFEKGSNAFTGSAGATKLESAAGTLECEAATSKGELQDAKTGIETVTYTGCQQEATKCSSAGEPAGIIQTEPVESVIYEGEKKAFIGLAGNPIMRFKCGETEYLLAGEVSGEIASGDIGVMSSKSESVFNAAVGYQGLKLEDPSGSFAATLTGTVLTTGKEAIEISRKDKEPTG